MEDRGLSWDDYCPLGSSKQGSDAEGSGWLGGLVELLGGSEVLIWGWWGVGVLVGGKSSLEKRCGKAGSGRALSLESPVFLFPLSSHPFN